VLDLVAEGRVRVVRLGGRARAYSYNGRWYIAARDLVEAVARDEAGLS
jgi:hypothetical protein